MESLFLVWLELVLIKSLNLNMDCACKRNETCRFLLTSGPNFVKLHTQREFYMYIQKKKIDQQNFSAVCLSFVCCFSGCRESLWQLSLKRWKWARYVCINFHLNIIPGGHGTGVMLNFVINEAVGLIAWLAV